ncbi:MAG: nucleoside triphosphate pyrophosphohydrolase family protein [Fischerella sp.]|nr:nucleoside triphosphate pyrophosphohydrolase family protein [Fischerella sp.]
MENSNKHDIQSSVSLSRYAQFVNDITSPTSKNVELFKQRIDELASLGCDVPRLTTAGIGLASEGGEFNEIVKKILFHGKDYNEDNIFHMKRELGDIIWYWINACIALGLNPNDVIAENVSKLESRYPGGKFSVWHSENRREGDL